MTTKKILFTHEQTLVIFDMQEKFKKEYKQKVKNAFGILYKKWDTGNQVLTYADLVEFEKELG